MLIRRLLDYSLPIAQIRPEAPTSAIDRLTWPSATSLMACGLLRYGTCVMSRPDLAFTSSIASDGSPPVPGELQVRGTGHSAGAPRSGAGVLRVAGGRRAREAYGCAPNS